MMEQPANAVAVESQTPDFEVLRSEKVEAAIEETIKENIDVDKQHASVSEFMHAVHGRIDHKS